jgi:hypothetical protein
LYFETVAECNRFLGDYAHTMATRNTPADTLESADIHINAENGEDAGTAQPFTFLLDLPRVYWRTSGPYIEGEDAVRQPMVGIAMHNTADGWPIKCEIVNTVEAADVIA